MYIFPVSTRLRQQLTRALFKQVLHVFLFSLCIVLRETYDVYDVVTRRIFFFLRCLEFGDYFAEETKTKKK